MVDAFPKKMEGEALDFKHSAVFAGDPRVEFDTGRNSDFLSVEINMIAMNFNIQKFSLDFCVSSNSKVVILTAGARQSEEENRLDVLKKNVEIFKTIIPQLVQYSPDAVFVVATNPGERNHA